MISAWVTAGVLVAGSWQAQRAEVASEAPMAAPSVPVQKATRPGDATAPEGTPEQTPPEQTSPEGSSTEPAEAEPTPEGAPPTDGTETADTTSDASAEAATASSAETHDPTQGSTGIGAEAPPPARVTDDERAPGRDDADDESVEPARRGFMLTAGAGVTHCAQDICSTVPMGGMARGELGFRWPHIAVVATAAGGGGHNGDEERDTESIRMLDVAAGLLVFPAAQGKLDPYFGASLGWAYFADVSREGSNPRRQYASRGAFRLSGGLMWLLGPRVGLGPRLDVQLPFGGKWCSAFENDEEPQCSNIRDEIIEDAEGVDRREIRRAFPRTWVLSLDLRFTL